MVPVEEHRTSRSCSFCNGEMETIRVERGGRRCSRRMRFTNVGYEAHFSHIKRDRDVGVAAKHIAIAGAAQHRGQERPLDLEEPPEGEDRTSERHREGATLHCKPQYKPTASASPRPGTAQSAVVLL